MISQAIVWVFFGLVVGAIARLLMPGRQSMGWIMTIALGIVGSFVGGTIGTLLFGGNVETQMLQPGGWIASILGGLLVLFVVGMVAKKSA